MRSSIREGIFKLQNPVDYVISYFICLCMIQILYYILIYTFYILPITIYLCYDSVEKQLSLYYKIYHEQEKNHYQHNNVVVNKPRTKFFN